MNQPLRVVMDTSVLVSAMRSRLGASFRLLELVQAGHVRLAASTSLYLEYESVVVRPEHTAALQVAPEHNLAALDDLLQYVDPV